MTNVPTGLPTPPCHSRMSTSSHERKQKQDRVLHTSNGKDRPCVTLLWWCSKQNQRMCVCVCVFTASSEKEETCKYEWDCGVLFVDAVQFDKNGGNVLISYRWSRWQKAGNASVDVWMNREKHWCHARELRSIESLFWNELHENCLGWLKDRRSLILRWPSLVNKQIFRWISENGKKTSWESAGNAPTHLIQETRCQLLDCFLEQEKPGSALKNRILLVEQRVCTSKEHFGFARY